MNRTRLIYECDHLDVMTSVLDGDRIVIKLDQAMKERDQAVAERDLVKRQLQDAEITINKMKEIHFKESHNVCADTVFYWNVYLTLTMVFGFVFAAIVTWYVTDNVVLGTIAGLGGVMLTPVSLLVFREYVRRNFIINGRRFD